jgi:hypothetical protein
MSASLTSDVGERCVGMYDSYIVALVVGIEEGSYWWLENLAHVASSRNFQHLTTTSTSTLSFVR